jgi:hypothetical protein
MSPDRLHGRESAVLLIGGRPVAALVQFHPGLADGCELLQLLEDVPGRFHAGGGLLAGRFTGKRDPATGRRIFDQVDPSEAMPVATLSPEPHRERP